MSSSNEQEFSGEVHVASSIVDFLSSGLYNSPAACLKELINNAYDADAEVVRVFVKPDADSIIIEDDGTGFTKQLFVEHFSHVSESTKRESGETTPGLKRKKIGLIGIGFIAANEICEEMEIISSVAGDPTRLHVTVDFRAMRLPRSERRRNNAEFRKGDYRGVVEPEEEAAHYTKIFLNEIRGAARQIMVSARRVVTNDVEGVSLYGLKPESVRARLSSPPRSWTDFDKYSQTMLSIGLSVPVQYLPDWLPPRHHHEAADITERASSAGFRVEYDGSDLRKPTVLVETRGRSVFRRFNFAGEHMAATGYLFASHGTLMPQELNGLLIRIRDAAVGEYDPAFLGYPKSVATLLQRWVSAEIWADDSLEEAMNIDRRTLREAHPAFAELQQLFHQELEGFLGVVRRELYAEPAAERRHEDAKQQEVEVERVVRRALPKSNDVDEALPWDKPLDEGDSRAERSLLRKFTVAQLYSLVVEVAEETLDAETRKQFMIEFGRRLRRRR